MNNHRRGGKRIPSNEDQMSAADMQEKYGSAHIRRRLPSDAFHKDRTPKNGNGSSDSCLHNPDNHRQNVVWTYLKYVGHRDGRPQHVGIMRTEDGRVFHIVRDFHSYMPERNGWYPCVVPKPGQKPLFMAKRKSFALEGAEIYTSEVLFAETVTEFVNDETEIIIIESSVSMPDDLLMSLMSNEAAIFFRKDDRCRIWIADSKKRKKAVRELSKKEKDIMNCENPWFIRKNGVITPPSVMSVLKRYTVEDIVSMVMDKPLEEICLENGIVKQMAGKTVITIGGI